MSDPPVSQPILRKQSSAFRLAVRRELNEQYNLGYTPHNTNLDGTYRSIRIAASRRGLTLRWKPGYFATAE